MSAVSQRAKDNAKACKLAYRLKNRDRLIANKKLYYAAHRDERKAQYAAFSAANPEKIRAKNAAYRAANKDRIDTQGRVYSKETPERIAKIKAYQKAYHAAHRGNLKLAAYQKAWAAAHPDKRMAYRAAGYARNKKKIAARYASWRKANQEKINHIKRRRRAHKFCNGGSHTIEELLEKFANLGDVCFYCGCSGKMTVDHDVPLSRGGSDFIDNILPSCKSCNSSKSAKTAQEFLFHRYFMESIKS